MNCDEFVNEVVDILSPPVDSNEVTPEQDEQLNELFAELTAERDALKAELEECEWNVRRALASVPEAKQMQAEHAQYKADNERLRAQLHRADDDANRATVRLTGLREAAEALAEAVASVHAAYAKSSAADEFGVQHLEDDLLRLQDVLAKVGK